MTLKNIIEGARALARPYLVYLFGGALAASAFLDTGAFERLEKPGLMILSFYFGSRTTTETK